MPYVKRLCGGAQFAGTLLLLSVQAGCGGGGSVNDPAFEPIPAPPLGTVVAERRVTAVRGQSALVESTVQGENPPGGIESVTISLPAGAILEEAILGIKVLAPDQSTLTRIKRADPSLVTRYTHVAEVVFGRADTAGNLTSFTNALSTGAAVSPVYRIQLTPEKSTSLDKFLSTEGITYELQVLVRDEASFTNRLIRPRDCRVTYDTALDLITVDHCRANDLIVSLVQVAP